MGKQNLPPLQEWTQLVFEQREEVGGEFVFAFSQGNAEMYNVSNSDPQEFPNMKVISNSSNIIFGLFFSLFGTQLEVEYLFSFPS